MLVDLSMRLCQLDAVKTLVPLSSGGGAQQQQQSPLPSSLIPDISMSLWQLIAIKILVSWCFTDETLPDSSYTFQSPMPAYILTRLSHIWILRFSPMLSIFHWDRSICLYGSIVPFTVSTIKLTTTTIPIYQMWVSDNNNRIL